MDNIVNEIEHIITQAAQQFERGLNIYWPVINPNKNSLKEANLTFHLASVAVSKGLYIYPEASNADCSNGHQRIDLLIHGKILDNSISILVEAKRLYSIEKATSIVIDYHRIRDFVFLQDTSIINSTINTAQKYGLLLALSTNSADANWWKTPYPYNQGWDMLKNILEHATKRDFVSIHPTRNQYILYAIYKL